MTYLQWRLAWMVQTLEASQASFRAWRQYFTHQAQELATAEPDEYLQLPMQLAAEIERLRSKFSPPNQPKPATRSTSPAPGRSQAGKASTSRPASSLREGA